MSANPDIICHEAPAPEAPEVKPETPAPAESGGSRTKLFVGIALFALAAGVAVSFMAMRAGGGDDAATASAKAETGGEEPSEDVATATDTGETPAECVGEIDDTQLRWYCTQYLPFAKKASADHIRIDRLEAAGKSSGGPNVPVALWVVVIGIGLLTVYNTVQIRSKKETPPNR